MPLAIISAVLLLMVACAASVPPSSVSAADELGAAPECATGPDAGEVARVAAASAAVYLVRPEGPIPARSQMEATPDFAEATEEARRRMREDRAGPDRATVDAGGMPFAVEVALKGTAPAALRMPAPDCAAPAYLALIGAEAAPVFVAVTGADDPLVDAARGALVP